MCSQRPLRGAHAPREGTESFQFQNSDPKLVLKLTCSCSMKTYRKNRIVKFWGTHASPKNLAVVPDPFFLSSGFVVQKNDYRKKRIFKFLLTHAYTKNLAVVSEPFFRVLSLWSKKTIIVKTELLNSGARTLNRKTLRLFRRGFSEL